MSLLRVYEPGECGKDGYPLAWHKGEPSIKDLVRELAGHRCIRCLHPYAKGQHGNGEWSPCDERCSHGPPYRFRRSAEEEWELHEAASLNSAKHVGDALGAQLALRVHARWRILTVHHLTGEKRDCRWWNLAALCQRCHLEIQGRVDMHKPYPWEHSEWMKPYVAGFYAWKYGGEELSREETEARLDELLDLGQRNESVERMPV